MSCIVTFCTPYSPGEECNYFYHYDELESDPPFVFFLGAREGGRFS